MSTSTTSSPNSQKSAAQLAMETARANAEKVLWETLPEHIGKLRRLKQWAGAIAHEKLMDESERQAKMIGLEDAAAARAAGWTDEAAASEEDDVGNRTTVLGDMVFTQTRETQQTSDQSTRGISKDMLKLILAGATGAGGVGLTQYFLDEQPPAVQPAEPGTHSTDVYDYRIDSRVIPPGELNE